VAPVIEEGKTARNIYLPAGKWRDGNDQQVYEGGNWIENYPAPLDKLPFFFRENIVESTTQDL
jgi:alpha-glucosidase (family GH31 glycosyl hydrolase)